MTQSVPNPPSGSTSLALPPIPDLWNELESLLRQVPPGRVASCGSLARGLGDVASALWIAQAMHDQDWFALAPRHRIVLRDGSPGKWSRQEPREWTRQLAAEGVTTTAGRVDMSRFGQTEFNGPRSLNRLRELQYELAERALIGPVRRRPRTVAGVDVAYGPAQTRELARGVASYVEYDVATHRQIWHTTVAGPVTFPYIKGYLAFRELPLLCQLLTEIRQLRPLADVIFVDGNGWLHPRHAGLATHLGVLADVPTIGVGKKLLCGRTDPAGAGNLRARFVKHNGDVVASAISTCAGIRPVYISAGHRIDLAGATDLALALCAGHRLPEPVALAHGAATRAAAHCR